MKKFWWLEAETIYRKVAWTKLQISLIWFPSIAQLRNISHLKWAKILVLKPSELF